MGVKETFRAIINILVRLLFCFVQFFCKQKLQLERVSVTVPGLAHSLKMVQITDIHFDNDILWPRVSESILDEMVHICNSENPDLILLTGDYVEYAAHPVLQLCERWLKKLQCTHGVYAVLGNHDYKEKGAREFIIKALSESGIRVLVNEVVYPLNGNKNIELIGLGDAGARHDFKVDVAFAHVSSNTTPTRIVLSHQPDTARKFLNFDIQLQLSGHTHGGQVCIPFTSEPLLKYAKTLHSISPQFLKKLFPKQIFVVQDWKWAAGLHRIKNNLGGCNVLYVSRGMATHPPLRFFCPPEITVITLNSPQ